MSVEINIPQFLVHLTSGMQLVEVEGETVGECLTNLVKRFPQLNSKIFSNNGKLLKYLDVCINGEIVMLGGLERPVNNGDKLFITNIIAGG